MEEAHEWIGRLATAIKGDDWKEFCSCIHRLSVEEIFNRFRCHSELQNLARLVRRVQVGLQASGERQPSYLPADIVWPNEEFVLKIGQLFWDDRLRHFWREAKQSSKPPIREGSA